MPGTLRGRHDLVARRISCQTFKVGWIEKVGKIRSQPVFAHVIETKLKQDQADRQPGYRIGRENILFLQICVGQREAEWHRDLGTGKPAAHPIGGDLISLPELVDQMKLRIAQP